MITFDKNSSLIHVANKNTSYVIFINERGILETLYFGKRVNNIKNVSWEKYIFGSLGYLNPDDDIMTLNRPGVDSSYSLQEVSGHGGEDKRQSPIVIKHENGSYLTRFFYVSHKIKKGIKSIEGMPSLDSKIGEVGESYNNKENVETIEITLKEQKYNIFLIYNLSIYKDKDILVKNFEIINKEKKPIKILSAYSLQLDLRESDYNVHQFYGTWAKERHEAVNSIQIGQQVIASNSGRSSHEFNPFIFLSKKDASLTAGEVIGFNLLYSGNFKMIFEKRFDTTLHCVYGMNDEDFEWILKKNEKFVTPQAVISYSSTGIDSMSQSFHDLVNENVIRREDRFVARPLIFNDWEGAFFDFNTKSILAYIDEAKKVNIDLFVLDDGWFGVRDNDMSGLGDWFVNHAKIDIHKVIDHLHELNIKFGLWFEPEMLNSDSDLYRAHKNYALGIGDNLKELSTSRNQLHLDFSNKEVVDNIFNQMCKIIDEYEIDYIKWDYNRFVNEHFSDAYPNDKQGEIYHRLVLGYYDLISRLETKYPHVFFEGCSSGGGRFDLGTLYYTPQIWTSDETDANERIYIQYGTSLGYPLSTISSHVSASPFASYKTKVDVALFGTFGYEMNPTKLTEEEFKVLNYGSEVYHKYHNEVIQNGTLYHLVSPFETKFMAMNSVSKNQDKAIALFYSKEKMHHVMMFLKLKGLNPKYQYKILNYNEVYSGEQLMNMGVNISRWFNEHETLLLILEKVD